MKKVIITAGGTSEKIDNVRKITNSSSGKLGMIIAEHLLEENDDYYTETPSKTFTILVRKIRILCGL